MSQVELHRAFQQGTEVPCPENVDPVPPSGEREAPDAGWRNAYARRLLVGDLVVLLVALTAAQLVRFGGTSNPPVDGLYVPYPVLGIALAVAWWISLQVHRVRSLRIIGNGSEEYRRVVVATFRAFAVLAFISVAFKIDASRLYIAIALPLGLAGLLVARKIARVGLHKARAKGRSLDRVLVVGGERSANTVARWFARHPSSGYVVSGVWVPDSTTSLASHLDPALRRVPLMTAEVDLAAALASSGAEAVVVTDTEHLGHESLRDLTWQLDGTGVDLLLSPNVLDVSSARLSLHDVSGMPLLHLREPQYAGAARIGKKLFDVFGALMIVLALSPVLLVTALAVKLTSVGPVFYRQERVGRDGSRFDMFKFRSMKVGADAHLEALLAAEGKTLAELPKLIRDPRVTRVGGFIRRFSIDELPQLLNVLKGDMSLVGPRPQRDFEVEGYDDVATRRLSVLPGMTGLWQVSGRSDLSYDDAIRLDVHYVENWSMTTDLMILWRTARAVVRTDGAY
jgi:exopolysaccharide biosynthesis polyprenyl glycosylphosphotransferase